MTEADPAQDKPYKLKPDDLKLMVMGKGLCIATDRITIDGMPVGYMARDEPSFERDSGWRFYAGDEDEAYLDEPNNFGVHDVNTIANYDPHIVPHLDADVGAELQRTNDGTFMPADDAD